MNSTLPGISMTYMAFSALSFPFYSVILRRGPMRRAINCPRHSSLSIKVIKLSSLFLTSWTATSCVGILIRAPARMGYSSGRFSSVSLQCIDIEIPPLMMFQLPVIQYPSQFWLLGVKERLPQCQHRCQPYSQSATLGRHNQADGAQRRESVAHLQKVCCHLMMRS